jgi:hypothetical protein
MSATDVTVQALEEIDPLRSAPADDAPEPEPDPWQSAAQCAADPEVLLKAYRRGEVKVRARRASDEVADELAEELAPVCGVDSQRLALALAWAADPATERGEAQP